MDSFCCVLLHPICVTFLPKDYRFLQLGPVFFLSLLVISGQLALRTKPRTTTAILTAMAFFLFLLSLPLHTPRLCDENQLHQFRYIYNFLNCLVCCKYGTEFPFVYGMKDYVVHTCTIFRKI